MRTEGPRDSPEGDEPTTLSAVEPLPPGSDAEQIVDDIDERLRSAGSDQVEESAQDAQSGDPASKAQSEDQPESADGEPSEAPD